MLTTRVVHLTGGHRLTPITGICSQCMQTDPSREKRTVSFPLVERATSAMPVLSWGIRTPVSILTLELLMAFGLGCISPEPILHVHSEPSPGLAPGSQVYKTC